MLAPELPEIVVGDCDRLTQVLVNLVGNALQFTEQGEIVLAAVPAGEGQVLISVRDTGIGIAPEKQSEIFAPFTQADVSSTPALRRHRSGTRHQSRVGASDGRGPGRRK